MRSSALARALLAVVALVPSLIACDDDLEHYLPLVPPAEKPIVAPNEVSGTFCTEDPGSLKFPVKIWFSVDDTGSMAMNDPNQRRFSSIKELATRLASPGDMFFGGLVFSTLRQQVFTVPRFIDDVAAFKTAVDSVTGVGSGGTPYLVTLQKTYAELQADIALDSTRARRTKYVVIFLSDGKPDPVEDDAAILAQVGLIAKLSELSGGMILNTVFLGGADPATEARLQNMAKAGNGLYKSFPSGDALDFKDFDFSGIRRNFVQRNFLVTNRSMLPTPNGQQVDSDGDGLSDEEELRLGTDATQRDTDGDGCSDLMEVRSAWNPKLAVAGQCSCTQAQLKDTDRDGLTDCEEGFLGSLATNPDSDLNVDGKVVGDLVTDGIDYIYMNDVVFPNDLKDRDRDGTGDLRELEEHTSVFAGDPDRAALSYRSPGVVQRQDLPRCSDFSVKNILLGRTLATADHAANENLVELYMFQSAQDDPFKEAMFRVARIRIPYAEGGVSVHVEAKDFTELLTAVKN